MKLNLLSLGHICHDACWCDESAVRCAGKAEVKVQPKSDYRTILFPPSCFPVNHIIILVIFYDGELGLFLAYKVRLLNTFLLYFTSFKRNRLYIKWVPARTVNIFRLCKI